MFVFRKNGFSKRFRPFALLPTIYSYVSVSLLVPVRALCVCVFVYVCGKHYKKVRASSTKVPRLNYCISLISLSRISNVASQRNTASKRGDNHILRDILRDKRCNSLDLNSNNNNGNVMNKENCNKIISSLSQVFLIVDLLITCPSNT